MKTVADHFSYTTSSQYNGNYTLVFWPSTYYTVIGISSSSSADVEYMLSAESRRATIVFSSHLNSAQGLYTIPVDTVRSYTVYLSSSEQFLVDTSTHEVALYVEDSSLVTLYASHYSSSNSYEQMGASLSILTLCILLTVQH